MTDSLRGFASRHGLTADSERGFASRHGLTSDSKRGFESGHGWVQSQRAFASSHGLTTDSLRGFESRQWPSAFSGYWASLTPSLTAPAVLVQFFVSDVPNTPLPVLNWKIRRSRSELVDWSLTLDNTAGDFSPGATSGLWAGKFDCDTHDADFNIRRYIQPEIVVGGHRWAKAPRLLVQDYAYNEDSNGATVTISGNCIAEILHEEDQLMPDVDATVAVRGSNDVIREILAQYKLKGQLEQENFTVLLLHRVGVPMDWIRQLCEVVQSWWMSESDQIVFRVGGWRDSTDWSLTDRHHLKVLSHRRTGQGEINSLTVQRVESTAGKAVEPREDKGIGIVRRALEYPIDRGQLHVSVQEGDYVDPYWLNDKGFVVASGSFYAGQYGPVSNVQFTILPNAVLSTGGTAIIQSTAYERTFRWWVDARKASDSPGFPKPSAYTGGYEASGNIAATYRKRHREPITNELIPDAASANRFAERAVKETLRGYNIATTTVLFNPEIEPGHMVSLTGAKSKLTNYRMLVDAVEHNGDEHQAITTLELSRPRVIE